MENINQLKKGNPEEMKFGSSENNMQGLYFDLLACIGGGDHPMLPQGYKMKPMKGFLDIIEAFNDVSKLNSAGSGIVFEVGSKDFEGQDLISDSRETLKRESTAEYEYDRLRQSSTDCDEIFGANIVKCGLDGVKLRSPLGLGSQHKKQQTDCRQKDEDVKEAYKNNDDKEKLQHDSQLGGPFRSKSSYIEEVGPTLKISNPMLLDPMHQEINSMEKEMQKYSEELREIERMLKEQLFMAESASATVFSNRQAPTDTSTNVAESTANTAPVSNSKSMVQILIDGLVNPSCALEMIMPSMESKKSPSNLKNPSNYQSCTSFASCQNQSSAAGNGLPNLDLDSSRKASSIYMDMEGFNADENDGNYPVKPFFISENVSTVNEHTTKENDQSVGEFVDCEDGNQFPTEMMDKLTPEDEANITNNDVSYFSVGEESDEQIFTDAADETRNKKRKRKIRFSDKSSATSASSENEHLWTSGSEYEDVGNVEIAS